MFLQKKFIEVFKHFIFVKKLLLNFDRKFNFGITSGLITEIFNFVTISGKLIKCVNIAIGKHGIINYVCRIDYSIVPKTFVTLYPKVYILGNGFISENIELSVEIQIFQ